MANPQICTCQGCEMSILRCCGNCHSFAFEDIDGFGWCRAGDRERECGETCVAHKWRNKTKSRILYKYVLTKLGRHEKIKIRTDCSESEA